jgi:hypothetical protein
MNMVLKPQDILVLLKIVVLRDTPWSYPMLAKSLFMSQSEVHASIQRAEAAHLFDRHRSRVLRSSLFEFLVHGLKYAFPAMRGGSTRGMPTGYAAPPLTSLIQGTGGDPPVWPDPEGEVRGNELSPLYRSVPKAASADPALYEMLALVDAIREGRAREATLAVQELKTRLELSK